MMRLELIIKPVQARTIPWAFGVFENVGFLKSIQADGKTRIMRTYVRVSEHTKRRFFEMMKFLVIAYESGDKRPSAAFFDTYSEADNYRMNAVCGFGAAAQIYEWAPHTMDGEPIFNEYGLSAEERANAWFEFISE